LGLAGVLCPDAAKAVSHELDAHRATVLPLRVLLGPAEDAELVLDGVPVLVRDDVLLGQGSAVGAETAGQLGKKLASM
jgi:hypothetical protein